MKFSTALVLCSLIYLTGCTSTLSYNPQYEGRLDPVPGAQLDGRAAILTTEEEDNYIYTDGPTSFTGGGSKISIPLGVITREISENAFERLFKEGAQITRDASTANQYVVVIKPRVTNFSYAYNQLKNAGLLVTPQVDMSLSIEILDSNQKVVHANTFVSGTKDGDSYFMSGSPAERINELAHAVITDLMNQAANEVYYFVNNSKS